MDECRCDHYHCTGTLAKLRLNIGRLAAATAMHSILMNGNSFNAIFPPFAPLAVYTVNSLKVQKLRKLVVELNSPQKLTTDAQRL